MGYSAEILADSVSPSGHRLTTWQITHPRFILAEVNTHRALSRNSASSRARPVEKVIAAVLEEPFVPEVWGENRPGMQATESLDEDLARQADKTWRSARDSAVVSAQELLRLGVHKQLANRLLEPFMWHTAIVSATELDNFFALRCHPDAQPQFQIIARMMREVQDTSTPVRKSLGEWHLPLVTDAAELRAGGMSDRDLAMVCAGRCARVSYLTHDGRRDPAEDIRLAERLLKSGHMSPFEHPARPYEPMGQDPKDLGNFRGWRQLRKMIPGEAVFRAQG